MRAAVMKRTAQRLERERVLLMMRASHRRPHPTRSDCRGLLINRELTEVT
jgi:hypothetical protein